MDAKTHTFGGSALDRYLIDYRAEEAAVLADAGGAPVEPAPAVAEAPAAAPAAEPWAVSREDWDRTQVALAESREFNQAILEALQEPEPEGAETPSFPLGGDPAAVQAWAEEIADRRAQAQFEQLYRERVEPYVPVLENFTREQSKTMVLGELDKIANGDKDRGIEGIGDFDREYAAKLAHAAYVSGVPAEQALLQAARDTLALQQRFSQAGAQGERQQFQNRVDQPAAPSGAGAAAEQGQPTRPTYESVAADWSDRRRAQGSPIG